MADDSWNPKPYHEFTDPVVRCFLLFGPNQAVFKKRLKEERLDDDQRKALESYIEAAK